MIIMSDMRHAKGYSQLMTSRPSTGKVGLGREFDQQTIHTV